MICYVCEKETDTRPYGIHAQHICFACMISDPEKEAEAKRQLTSVFDIAQTATGMIILTDEGIVR